MQKAPTLYNSKPCRHPHTFKYMLSVVLRAQPTALWFNMREEVVVYINGQPFVLREDGRPFKNMQVTPMLGPLGHMPGLTLLGLTRQNCRYVRHDLRPMGHALDHARHSHPLPLAWHGLCTGARLR